MQQDEGYLRLESRSNHRFKAFKQLAHDNDGARVQKRVWLEGDHLVRAAVQRGVAIAEVVATEEGLAQWGQLGLVRPKACTLLSQGLWKELSQLTSVWQFAAMVDLPAPDTVDGSCPSVVLDRIQDPGNVGSILRSASAFGYRQVLALKGTASLWSPKVLRAAMGAHFGLHVHESLSIADLAPLKQFRCVTSSHLGKPLSALKGATGGQSLVWIFGNEGQGVASTFLDSADLHVRIDQPGGEESLNVAAAAAICLHSTAVR